MSLLQRLRDETHCQTFWKSVSAKAQSLGADSPTLLGNADHSKKLEDFAGYDPNPAHPEKLEDLYRRHYFEALDCVTN